MAYLAGLLKLVALRTVHEECVSMAILVYAHGTKILTIRERSELVVEYIFYALQASTRTI